MKRKAKQAKTTRLPNKAPYCVIDAEALMQRLDRHVGLEGAVAPELAELVVLGNHVGVRVFLQKLCLAR